MRRLFIIRKDLNLSPGKLAAMVAHCSEAYWTNIIRKSLIKKIYMEDNSKYKIQFTLPSNILEEYVNNSFVKTICEAKNLKHLKKAAAAAKKLGLKEGEDFGYINDNCLTELMPENDDGTCTVGIWFKPLNDEVSHLISKKYQLYRG